MSKADELRAAMLEPGCTQTSVKIGRLRRLRFGTLTSRRQTKPVESVNATPAHLRGDDSAAYTKMRELFDPTKLPMKPPGK